ncbi:CRISPR-associated endonuclease Cas2 [Kutzneria buriramensis]|uniref:CRISPR-associated endoribonuclease Cas2 n=1 Tax=Kutzneria buriramensis TaxID=1045776 RepID=A0A3E0HLI9_9PSEU|nr:CRISPR-associated endonuclease Cas2 [Kutzneria buriramensis]REH47334.1 CRISPR-associated protein Cas2 [Kutzneria buriramensis]
MALTVLVCYDISADGARARVAAYLQQWGDRLQRSVFVCAVASDELAEVTGRLAAMIEPSTDAVHVLPVCGTCWSKLVAIGQAEREPDKPYWAAL